MVKSENNEHTHVVLDSEQIAKEAFTDALRELAKNVLAIGEGGGAPDELVGQIVKIAESLLVFKEVHGRRPGPELIRKVLTRLSEN